MNIQYYCLILRDKRAERYLKGAMHMAVSGTIPRKERIVELDVLRGLALLGVVLQHALGVYIRRPDIQPADAVMIGMLFNLSKFAVPAFVFVTGTVLFYNYYGKFNYLRFMWKRVLEIFLPYLLWTGIYDVYYNGIPSTGLPWLKEFVKKVVLGEGSYHLWFVVMIFQFYFFYPVLLALFKQVCRWVAAGNRRFAMTLALLTGLYILLMWFSASYIPNRNFYLDSKVLNMFLVELRDRNFIYYFFYFFLGGIAGVALQRWRDFVSRSASWNPFLFVTLFLWIGYELMKGAAGGLVNLNYSTSLKPSMFFYTVSEIILLYGLSLAVVKNNPVTLKLLELTGNFSYGAYLSHALVLIYVIRGMDHFLPPGHQLWMSMVAFLLTAVISTGITALINRIPCGKLLIGP